MLNEDFCYLSESVLFRLVLTFAGISLASAGLMDEVTNDDASDMPAKACDHAKQN